MNDLNLLWAIWICCERFVICYEWFGNSLWAIWNCCGRFEFAVSDLNLLWAIWIWCERFEFAVSDLNLMWAIWIWCERFLICCEHLVLMWQLWATVEINSKMANSHTSNKSNLQELFFVSYSILSDTYNRFTSHIFTAECNQDISCFKIPFVKFGSLRVGTGRFGLISTRKR